MSARFKTGTFFIVGNAVAGVFHYLFQVIAARELSSNDFAQLNSWLAYVTVFLLLATLLQVQSNFVSLKKSSLHKILTSINVAALFFFGLWWLSPEGFSFGHGACLVAIACLSGWLLGQSQRRFLFGVMTIANLGVGSLKCAFALLPLGVLTASPLDKFALALVAPTLPAIWWLSYRLWKEQGEAVDANAAPLSSATIWTAPLLIAITGALVPSIDIILIERLQSREMFETFARASVFFKAVYFGVFNVAQLLLPHQIRNGRSGATKFNSWLLLIVTFGGCALISLVAPFLAEMLLGWSEAPPQWLIFLACLNVSLMAWFYVLIQKACAEGQLQVAFGAFTLFMVEIGIQFLGSWPLNGYMAFAIGMQAVILLWLTNPPRLPWAKKI